MSQYVHAINDDQFQAEVLDSTVPVVVDFWADWCGPCKMLAPIFEETATELAGKVKFVKVNVDESSRYAAKYGIRSIPSLLLFKAGEVVANQVGLLNQVQLKSFVQQALS